jgi:hypothetical protein
MVIAIVFACTHENGRMRIRIRPFSKLSLLALGLQYLLAAVYAGGRDVVTQMHFPGSRFDSEGGIGQKVVGAMHATLGRGLLVLLYGHVNTPCFLDPISIDFQFAQHRER